MTEIRDMSGPRKLDVLAGVAEAYRGVWKNLGEMLQLIWLPGLIYLALSIAPALLKLTPDSWAYVPLMLASNLIWPVIAIAWHRFILAGDSSSTSFRFEYGRRELRYLFVTLALMLLFIPAMLLAGVMAAMTESGSQQNASLMSFFGLIFLLAAIYFFIRLALLLPAVAMDAPLDVQLILERTRGNFWRLLSMFLLGGLPMLVILQLIGLAVQGGLPAILGQVLTVLLMVFFAVLGVAVLSIAYRQLVQADTPH